jgi:hypothetical protein
MHEQTLYPVCPHRNVAAAYMRFLGPDSGGMERFFLNQRIHWAGGAPVIVRVQGRSAAPRIAAVVAGLRALSALGLLRDLLD